MMTIDFTPQRIALALALRMDCPIFVDEVVLKNSKISSAFYGAQIPTSSSAHGWMGLSDEDLGRYKM